MEYVGSNPGWSIQEIRFEISATSLCGNLCALPRYKRPGALGQAP